MEFKIHFRQAHKELKETGQLTMEQMDYHQANLVSEIMEQLDVKLEYFKQSQEDYMTTTTYPTYISPYHANSDMYQPQVPTNTSLQSRMTQPTILQDEVNKKLLVQIELLTKTASNLKTVTRTPHRRNPTDPRQGQPRNQQGNKAFPNYC